MCSSCITGEKIRGYSILKTERQWIIKYQVGPFDLCCVTSYIGWDELSHAYDAHKELITDWTIYLDANDVMIC